jgi:hypothetical protein
MTELAPEKPEFLVQTRWGRACGSDDDGRRRVGHCGPWAVVLGPPDGGMANRVVVLPSATAACSDAPTLSVSRKQVPHGRWPPAHAPG